MRFSMLFVTTPQSEDDDTPRGARLQFFAGTGALWIETHGVGIRTRRREVAWLRRGRWCPLHSRDWPEGRFGRFIYERRTA